jgi:hypothetical protein
MRSDKFVRLCVGPVGSGKSSVCVLELVSRAMRTPIGADGVRRSRFAVIRNTYPELRDTTINTFNEWIPQDGSYGEWIASENKFILRPPMADGSRCEAEILFRALDRPEDQKKLLSLEITGAWFNEAKEIPRPVFDLIQSRIGRYPAVKNLSGQRAWSGLWADTNPPDTDHYLYHLFEEQLPDDPDTFKDWELFRQPGGLDPQAENIENLPGGRDYYLRMMVGKKQAWIDVFVHAKYGYVQDGRPIYEEFQDNIHVAECFPIAKIPIIMGADFGLTPAMVFGQRDPRDGQYQILEEYVSERMGAETFGKETARILKTTYKNRQAHGWGDPAGDQSSQTDERTPFQVVNSYGVPLDPAPTNDFELRRGAVANLLKTLTMMGRPALVIHPRCRVLRKAMAGAYCLRRIQVAGDERYKDAPDKNPFSHVAEALQYLAVGEGEDSRQVDSGENRRIAVKIKVKRSVNLGGRRR